MKRCPRCGKEYEDINTLCPADGAALEKTTDDLIGQTLAGKYRIEEKISQGGMATVYKGVHVLMEKVVAIKVLHPALAADEKIVERFSREAKAASRISNPHALNVTDFGQSADGIVFLVMEYLEGRTLKRVVNDEWPMALPRVANIVRQISEALEAAHAQGVVHRDLKSDNIMLQTSLDGSEWAKVLDFGIAKIQEPLSQDPSLTAPNLIIGTPQYMSPEQCSQASHLDARSDIYSLGVIVFEMLIGHVPFPGESPTAIMLQHIQDPPPSVLDERKDLSVEVAKVVEKALAKKPGERFQSAAELSQAFSTAAGIEPMRVSMPVISRLEEPSKPRIVISTDSEEIAKLYESEETLVRAKRDEVAEGRGAARITVQTNPVPQDSFNPWKIVIPAVAGIVALFAVVFVVSSIRNPETSTPVQQDTLAIDPSSQPVQPGQAATGEAEQNLGTESPASSPTPAQQSDLERLAPTPDIPEEDANANSAEKVRNDNGSEGPSETNANRSKEPPQVKPSPAVEVPKEPAPSPAPLKQIPSPASKPPAETPGI